MCLPAAACSWIDLLIMSKTILSIEDFRRSLAATKTWPAPQSPLCRVQSPSFRHSKAQASCPPRVVDNHRGHVPKRPHRRLQLLQRPRHLQVPDGLRSIWQHFDMLPHRDNMSEQCHFLGKQLSFRPTEEHLMFPTRRKQFPERLLMVPHLLLERSRRCRFARTQRQVIHIRVRPW